MPQSKPKVNIESNGSMTFEPLKPGAPPIVDKTQPVLRDGAIPPAGNPLISPEPNVIPTFGMEPAPKAVPEDWKRPGFTGIVKI